MTPMKLRPAYKDYLWGGQRLITDYGKQTDLNPLAESWELSCHPDGESVILTGPAAGKTLRELLSSPEGKAILGDNCARFSFFPVLIKLIDAKNPLSIQVHPSDEYALKYEHSYGKTEMWIILDAEEDSFLYYGVNRAVSAEELREAIEGNCLEGLLQKRPVKRGDVVFIPAGTLHAIGAGILLCEVQQNSNLTYRVYDYGRLGADGKPRALHIDKALKVTNLVPSSGDFSPKGRPVSVGSAVQTLLADSPYFKVERVELDGELHARTDGSSFISLLCVEGEGTLNSAGETLKLYKGDSLFIPANAGEYTLSGHGEWIKTVIPPR